jgi:hypothetical protein
LTTRPLPLTYPHGSLSCSTFDGVQNGKLNRFAP